MGYSIVAEIPFSELVQKLHDITLCGDESIKPYSKAEISIESVEPTELRPMQRYLMESRLDNLPRFRDELIRDAGIDMMRLDKGYVFTDGTDLYGLLPPIVEVSYYDQGTPKVILDGSHRCYLSLVGGKNINVILVDNCNIPLHSFPNSWDNLKICATPPPDSEKRTYRSYNPRFYHRFRRDIDKIFEEFATDGRKVLMTGRRL